ncbi:hypothetical protein [Thalassovita mangrovi]|uniref:Uncharacterized protein n=1 Tax=Thalassovita mangrovi TaxID=2692236 RepID=A0A6L8LJG6_9RHOB|nr:hypothetical protein [Thalassovita mangrovi]MYM54620.1 hypothetical protein [Thalassovita mangrovi]
MAKRIVFAAALSLILTGCEAARDELYSPDGFPAPYMDKVATAVTPEQRADRYLLGLALLAPAVLETSGTGKEMETSISLVNSTYASLAKLYEASNKCSDPKSPEKGCTQSRSEEKKKTHVPNTYAFETHSYDVQKKFYRLGKTLILNLDLDETVDEILAFDVTTITNLYERGKEIVPAVRRGTATYRDAVLIYASAVAQSCRVKHCDDLTKLLEAQYSKVSKASATPDGERYFHRLQRLARQEADGRDWVLGEQRRRALVYHVDKACDAAYEFQTIGEDKTTTPEVCGNGQKQNGSPNQKTSTERDRFLTIVHSIPPKPVAPQKEGELQANAQGG